MTLWRFLGTATVYVGAAYVQFASLIDAHHVSYRVVCAPSLRPVIIIDHQLKITGSSALDSLGSIAWLWKTGTVRHSVVTHACLMT